MRSARRCCVCMSRRFRFCSGATGGILAALHLHRLDVKTFRKAIDSKLASGHRGRRSEGRRSKETGRAIAIVDSGAALLLES